MGTSVMFSQVLPISVGHQVCPDTFFRSFSSVLAIRSNVKLRKRRYLGFVQSVKCLSVLKGCVGSYDYGLSRVGNGKSSNDRFRSLTCPCQKAESISGVTAEDGNGSLLGDAMNMSKPIDNGNVSSPNGVGFQGVQPLSFEKEVVAPNGNVGGSTSQKTSVDSIEEEAWNLLKESMVYYCGSPIGTIAAKDPTSSNVLNYDQVFIRDFIPSGMAFLLKGDYDIVRNFILHTLQLQSWEKTMDCHSPGQGLMPASFKVRTVPLDGDELAFEEVLDPDFGEAAIGRVAPVDSADLIRALNNRLVALSFHIREYYWIDMKKLNEIYRYKTEEYSYDAVNKFNIYPDQIPPWLVEWMPSTGGYLIGNLQPAHMDFRFFALGNLWSIINSLATKDQSHAILDLIESKWSDLVADMPLKICYPALEGQEWRIITGSDPKNTPWSYHNAGSWPTLLWQFTVACIKMGRPETAAKAVAIAEKRLSQDKWPEYYDTKRARFIGKQACLYQTWSIAGYLVSKLLLKDPSLAKMLTSEEDHELVNAFYCMIDNNPRRKRGRKPPSKQTYIV
ncbi:hypothetical protein ACHQM5_010181 [Ranunculus cassubicifolius]